MSAAKVPILLVDDDANNLVALAAILDRPDYSLFKTSSGEKALSLLLEQDFALVLLDVMMPEMDGFMVASSMKSIARTRYIPIIFVTAIARSAGEIYRGYAVGGVDYIQKPLDPDIVKAKVAVFVELYRQRKEIERQEEIILESERAQALEREKAARLRAEAAEQRYYDLINWVDHAVLWEYDIAARKFSFVGRRSAQIFKLSPEKWVRNPAYFTGHIHPDDQKTFDEVIEKAISHGIAGQCEIRLFGGNGETYWVHCGVNPRKDIAGNVTLLWGLTLDISAFKSSEANQTLLAQTSALLTASLDFSENIGKVGQLLVKSTVDWCVVDLLFPAGPPKRVTVAQHLQDKPWVHHLHTHYPLRRGPNSPVAKAVDTGEPVLWSSVTEDLLKSIAEDQEHLKVLKEIPMQSLLILPIKARETVLGTLTLVSNDPYHRFKESDLNFGRDLAWHIASALDNAQLYSAAHKAMLVREEVLRIVSHDLRVPLAAIRLNAQLLSRRQSEPIVRGERIVRSVDEMDRLITDLLDLSKIESGTFKIEKSTYSAQQLINEVAESVSAIADANRISVKQDVPRENIPLLVDRNRLYQALSNIVGNALKFTPANGTVTIGSRLETREVLLWVSDTGPGILPEELPHVFERFWQSKQGEQAKGSSGLGLAIAKSMVEAHQGRIWVESKPGAGTTFFISLPNFEIPQQTAQGAA